MGRSRGLWSPPRNASDGLREPSATRAAPQPQRRRACRSSSGETSSNEVERRLDGLSDVVGEARGAVEIGRRSLDEARAPAEQAGAPRLVRAIGAVETALMEAGVHVATLLSAIERGRSDAGGQGRILSAEPAIRTGPGTRVFR